jgi:hypothetical protein
VGQGASAGRAVGAASGNRRPCGSRRPSAWLPSARQFFALAVHVVEVVDDVVQEILREGQDSEH